MKLRAGPISVWAALIGNLLVTATKAVPAPAQGEREVRGALFLRADRLEGDNRRITASGNVELRTRQETVLAERLVYDVPSQTIYGDGDVVLRRDFDWITGPQLQYKRDTEVGFFRKPRFFIAQTDGHGDAAEIRFTGPNHYEASDASYTTCIAPHPDL